jgi:hypothetical protein
MLLKEYPDSKLFKDSLTKIKDVLRIIGQTDTTKLVDFNRMQALQGRLEGRVNILEPHRFVVHEETLVVVDDDDDGMQDSVSGLKTLLVGGSSSSKVHVVLFNDALLTAAATSLRSDSPLIFERFIPLDAIKLGLESVTSGTASRPSSTSAVAAMEASTPEKEAASKILKIETFGYTYLFRCGSVDSKERWIELISQHQLPILQEVAKRQQLIARSPSQPLSTPTSPRSSDAPKVGLTASLSSAQTSALNTAARLSRRIEPASVREMFAGTMTWGKKNHLVLEVMGKMQSEKVRVQCWKSFANEVPLHALVSCSSLRSLQRSEFLSSLAQMVLLLAAKSRTHLRSPAKAFCTYPMTRAFRATTARSPSMW